MLKYITFIIIIFSFLTGKSQCTDELLTEASKSLDNFVYVKDFKIKLKEAVEKRDAKEVTYTVILNKGVNYKFILADAKEYDGKLVFELFGDRGKLVSSYNEDLDKHYSVIEYSCKRSGMYFINLGFEGAKEGCGILVYSFEKK